MKQHITVEQWNEMSFDNQLKIIEWCKSKGYHEGSLTMLLSIGQLIEFLVEHKHYEPWREWQLDDSIVSICDDLWEAVKELINSEREK